MAFDLYSKLIKPAWSDDDSSFEDRPGPSSSRKTAASKASTAKKSHVRRMSHGRRV